MTKGAQEHPDIGGDIGGAPFDSHTAFRAVCQRWEIARRLTAAMEWLSPDEAKAAQRARALIHDCCEYRSAYASSEAHSLRAKLTFLMTTDLGKDRHFVALAGPIIEHIRAFR
ncbi:MAG: hypothetical protein EA402_03310 [Planctomycetota bacterium]|nr:MAG: hypothetical protein EA402_03310 [Planctomycetota bacterium]